MINYSYHDMWQRVMRQGVLVEPRGTKTKELLHLTLAVPGDVAPLRKGMVQALGYMELCQLVAGVFDGRALKRVAPKADHSLFTEQMAYGPRVDMGPNSHNQVQRAIEKLTLDPNTRRAVVMVARPSDRDSEVPCTLSIQFLIRGGHLQTFVTMRSWDLWWGLPYDMVMFNGLAMIVAQCLGIPVGNTAVTAGSAHIYEGFWDKEPKLESDLIVLDYESRLFTDWQHWALVQVHNEGWDKGVPLGISQLTTAQWYQRQGGHGS